MTYNLIAKFVFALLSVYLLVDSVNGFLLLGLGIDAKISAIYKSTLLVLLVLYLLQCRPLVLLIAFFFFCLLLLGETYSVISLNTSAEKIGFLLQHIIKVLSPLLMFFFLLDRSDRDAGLFDKVERVLGVNACVFAANMVAGSLGYGYSTYGGEESSYMLGSKGFFYAGNEVSALLIIFCGYYLSKSYLRSKFGFFVVAVSFLLMGFLISTKTSILAVVLLVLFIPMIFEGKRLLYCNNLPSIIFLLGVALASVQAVVIFEAFMEVPLYGRLLFFFDKHGVVGVLFSGREIFINEIIYYFGKTNVLVSMIIGNGMSYYADYTKFAVEIDILDMFFWHGMIGVLISVGIFSCLSYFALKNSRNLYHPMAAGILLTNVLLFCVANFSGHIFTSGMLAFLWPCFAIMAKYSPPKAASV